MRRLLSLFALWVCAGSALAQASYPAQPIRWLVPYAPGGSVDTLVRTLGDAMQPSLGQAFVIENKPGGATNIAVSALMQAKPDGHTLLHAENTSLFLNEHLYAKPMFKPETDFSYVAAIGRIPVSLVVGPTFPAKTLAEFIAHVKKHPDTVVYASPGVGTTHHMTMELLKEQASLKMQHVPYRGGLLAMQDIAGGQVSAMMVEATVAMQFVKSGRLRVLAVAGKQRVAALPDVPTFTELGMPSIEAYTLHGLVGPAGLPTDVVKRLNDEVKNALRQPKVMAYLGESGFEPLTITPQAFKDMARAESVRWGRIIKKAGIKLD